jgi:hypothetical protein
MHHHHYNHLKGENENDSSQEDCYVLPFQKIFYLDEEFKDYVNGMLEHNEYSLQNFDELDINCFQLREREKIVNSIEILLINHIRIQKNF